MKRIASVLVTLLLAGCATSGIEAGAMAVPGPDGVVRYEPRVVVGNNRLGRRIAVARINEEFVGGLLRAAVTLQSMTDDTEALQYRWTWFDTKGFEVNSSSQAWQPLLVYGEQSTAVQGLAPNAAAKSFKLHLRYQD